MESLQEQVVALLQQRKAFSQSFYAYSINMQDNSGRILALVSLLNNEQENEISVFNCEKVTELVTLISEYYRCYDKWQWVFILQILCQDNVDAQQLVEQLIQQPEVDLQTLAFELLLTINKPLIVSFPAKSTALLPLYFTWLFYQGEQATINNIQLSQGKDRNNEAVLYKTVLSGIEVDELSLIEDFISLTLLESHLFKLFIVRLNEFTVTQVVNQLATDKDNIKLIIEVMALSGYSKFIPFICRFLQDTNLYLTAYNALRLLLNDKLDHYIPLAVQLSTDQQQRQKAFKAYGEVMLAKWASELSPNLPQRVLAGGAINDVNLEKVWLNGSQAHRQVAALYQAYDSSDHANYYALPECVL